MPATAAKKRKRAGPPSTASTAPSQASTSLVKDAAAGAPEKKTPSRPKKRAKMVPDVPTPSAAPAAPVPEPGAKTTVEGTEGASNTSDKVLQAVEEALQAQEKPPSKPEKAADCRKRPKIAGRVRKLAPPKPRSAKTTLSGHRLAGVPSARLSSSALHPPAATEMWIRRKTGFSHYLKKGLEVFRKGKGTELRIRAMGAAIGMAMGVALAIEDALGAVEGALERQVKTSTETVRDEIEPEDRAQDIQYQDREQSAVEIILRVAPSRPNKPMASRLAPAGRTT